MKGGIANLIKVAEFILMDLNSTLNQETTEMLEHAVHAAKQEEAEHAAADPVEAAVVALEDAVLGVCNQKS